MAWRRQGETGRADAADWASLLWLVVPAPAFAGAVVLLARSFALPMQIMLMGTAAFLVTAVSWRFAKLRDPRLRVLAWAMVVAYVLLAVGFDGLQQRPPQTWRSWESHASAFFLWAALLQAAAAVAWAPARSWADGAAAFALPFAAFVVVRLATQLDWGYAYFDTWAVKVVYAPWLWPFAWWVARAGNPDGEWRHLAATAGACVLAWLAWLAWEFSDALHWLARPWSTIPRGGWVNVFQSAARIALLLVTVGAWLAWLRPRSRREVFSLAGIAGAILVWAWLVPWSYEIPT